MKMCGNNTLKHHWKTSRIRPEQFPLQCNLRFTHHANILKGIDIKYLASPECL